jgi:hypothetical protein
MGRDHLEAVLRANPPSAAVLRRESRRLEDFRNWIAKEAEHRQVERLAHSIGPHLLTDGSIKDLAAFVAAGLDAQTMLAAPAATWAEYAVVRSGARACNARNWGLHTVAKAPLPPETWLVHFTHDPLPLKAEGFLGTPDASPSALYSTFGRDRVERGYNFAFLADGYESWAYSRDDLYGTDALLFQASCVELFHSADGDGEVLFWGEDVDPETMLHFARDAVDDEWRLRGSDDARNADLAALITGVRNDAVGEPAMPVC